jgi:hypothetical protein
MEDVDSSWEFGRWYWTKAELTTWARRLGLPSSGSKSDLAKTISRALDGISPTNRSVAPTPEAPTARPKTPSRRQVGPQLTGDLTPHTIIPKGQCSSQALRRFFASHIGPSFRFDKPMRDFIATGAGKTLQQALDHWHATRAGLKSTEIAPQFEYNRFMREWYAAHPGAMQEEVIEAWKMYRNSPRY